MALITSHTLNGVFGSHAGGIRVQLVAVAAGAAPLFDTEMDAGGRLSQTVSPDLIDPDVSYDLVFFVGAYWKAWMPVADMKHINEQIVIRFSMPDKEGHYHMPVILNPHAYSVWMSGA